MKEKQSDCITAFVLMLFTSPFIAAFRGLTLMYLWKWFVVSTFKVHELSIPQALGLTIMVFMLTGSSNKKEDSTSDGPTDAVITYIVQSVGTCLLCLALGRIYLMFM